MDALTALECAGWVEVGPHTWTHASFGEGARFSSQEALGLQHVRRPRPCRCARPIVCHDPWMGDRTCVLCGHSVQGR